MLRIVFWGQWPECHVTTQHQWCVRGLRPPTHPPHYPFLKELGQIVLHAFGAIFHRVVGPLHMPQYLALLLSFCWGSYCLFACTDFRKRLGTPPPPRCATQDGSWRFLGERIFGLVPQWPAKTSGPGGGIPTPPPDPPPPQVEVWQWPGVTAFRAHKVPRHISLEP